MYFDCCADNFSGDFVVQHGMTEFTTEYAESTE
jgi:hypothetical protein